MIVKFKNEESWIYKDGIIEVNKRQFTNNELLKRYKQSIIEGIRSNDTLPSAESVDIAWFNKIFEGASDYVNVQCPIKCLLKPTQFILFDITTIIILSCKNQNENEAIVTNQQTYLLNDEGKTIERLV